MVTTGVLGLKLDIHKRRPYHARSHSCEKGLLASPYPPVCPYILARLPLDEFKYNLIGGTHTNICQETPHLVNIGQKYRPHYKKI
jgi:hypothetical protein